MQPFDVRCFGISALSNPAISRIPNPETNTKAWFFASEMRGTVYTGASEIAPEPYLDHKNSFTISSLPCFRDKTSYLLATQKAGQSSDWPHIISEKQASLFRAHQQAYTPILSQDARHAARAASS